MRIVLKTLGALLLVVLSIFLFFIFWPILTANGFIIPKESSILSFKSTEMNDGNGDYWLYGEDKKYYYSQMKASKDESYIKISKEEASIIENFDKTNFKTWGYEYLCEDLLETYAKKPEGLKFIKCDTVKNSQTIIKAIYKVDGKDSQMVEEFLVEKYGMGHLKLACCGWESGGQYGEFNHKELKEIHPYLSGIITMEGAEKIIDSNESEGIKFELDRNKINSFTVVVELVIV